MTGIGRYLRRSILLLVAGISLLLIALYWAAAPDWSWFSFAYDIGVGGLISLFFYWLLVHIPFSRRVSALRRHILLRYHDMKRECVIQLLFASGMPSVNSDLWSELEAPAAFREHFYANQRELWYKALNELDYGESFCFEAIIRAMERFRLELDFVLDKTELDDESFLRLRGLVLRLHDMSKVQRGTEDMKSFFGTLQTILGGWTGDGTVDYDPIERLLKGKSIAA